MGARGEGGAGGGGDGAGTIFVITAGAVVEETARPSISDATEVFAASGRRELATCAAAASEETAIVAVIWTLPG